jgi:hypothetical protein
MLAGCTDSAPAVEIDAVIVGGASVGGTVTISLSGPVGKPGEFNLPHVSGLTVNGSGNNPNTNPPTYNFFVTPDHAGDITIPAFYIHSDDGQTFHVRPLTLHVTAGG